MKFGLAMYTACKLSYSNSSMSSFLLWLSQFAQIVHFESWLGQSIVVMLMGKLSNYKKLIDKLKFHCISISMRSCYFPFVRDGFFIPHKEPVIVANEIDSEVCLWKWSGHCSWHDSIQCVSFSLSDLGWGLMELHSLNSRSGRLFILRNNVLVSYNHIRIWQVSPQLSCGNICLI